MTDGIAKPPTIRSHNAMCPRLLTADPPTADRRQFCATYPGRSHARRTLDARARPIRRQFCAMYPGRSHDTLSTLAFDRLFGFICGRRASLFFLRPRVTFLGVLVRIFEFWRFGAHF